MNRPLNYVSECTLPSGLGWKVYAEAIMCLQLSKAGQVYTSTHTAVQRQRCVQICDTRTMYNKPSAKQQQ